LPSLARTHRGTTLQQQLRFSSFMFSCKYFLQQNIVMFLGSVVQIFDFTYSYGAFIDVNQYTVATEIFPSHLRSQGSSYSLAAFFLTDVLWVDLAATAQATIGWKYYLVFLCLGIVHLIHLWFKLPEVCQYSSDFYID
jgi:hypothetical protein